MIVKYGRADGSVRGNVCVLRIANDTEFMYLCSYVPISQMFEYSVNKH